MKVYTRNTNIILNSQFNDPLLNHITKKIISYLRYAKGKKIFDLGCGVGRVSILAALEGFSVLGIDIERKAIEIARTKAKKLGLGNVCEFKHGDVLRTDYLKSNQFDIVICSEVIEHVKQPDRIINLAHRILKKNGLLILTTPNNPKLWTVLDEYAQHIKRFRAEEIKALLANYKILKLYTIGFPFMRVIISSYNLFSKFGLAKHNAEWRKNASANKIYNMFVGFLLKVDDLFNFLNIGTTIVVVAKKPKFLNL